METEFNLVAHYQQSNFIVLNDALNLLILINYQINILNIKHNSNDVLSCQRFVW